MSRLGLRSKSARLLCLAIAFTLAGQAKAQINERDRLERCANNRARVAQLETQMAAAWSDQQIADARRTIPQLEDLRDRVREWIDEDNDTAAATRFTQDMSRLAWPFAVYCFPFGIACADIYVPELNRKIRAAEVFRVQRPALERQLANHRTNLIALRCDQVAGGPGDGDNAAAARWMTGTFDTSFNTLTLSPGGGSYDYYGGQVRVSSIQGNVMEGIWTQTRAGRQCPDGRYYGRFRFSFSATGFSGSFGYCDEEPGAGAWNGTRR